MTASAPNLPSHARASDPSSELAGALGKSGEFASLEQETFFNLIRAHEAVTEPFAKLFKSRGISMPLYNILRILRGNGARVGTKTGLAIQRIGEQMLTREPDMTRLIDRLQKTGLAERKRCDEDRRVVHVQITRAGLELLASLDGPVSSLHAESMKPLSRADLRVLNELLFSARSGDGDV